MQKYKEKRIKIVKYNKYINTSQKTMEKIYYNVTCKKHAENNEEKDKNHKME